MRNYAIGIDLGTTFSCVGVVKNGRVNIIHNDDGPRITDSCIAFTEHQRLIGKPAKNQAIRNFKNTVFDVKRLIGRKFEEDTVQQDIRHWPFDVINVDGRCKVRVQYRGQTITFTPEELSAMVLTKMKESAEAVLQQEVKDAVITVPAYFNDAQRQATVDAATIAGLNVLRIINEPTAAGIAYILDNKTPRQQNILIYDLGGGTFDVTIMTIENGGWLFTGQRRSICVKSTSGDTHLGGNDFDMCLAAYCVADFKERYDIDITNNQRAMTKLRKSCEEAKKILSEQEQTSIEVEALANAIDYSLDITRTRFDKLCEQLFRKTLESVDNALVAAKLNKEQIDEIILVGGSTRIVKIRNLLREFFGGKELNNSIQPDEVVAYGAAIQAAILAGDKTEFLRNVSIQDVTPITLGLAMYDGTFSKMIMKNTPIPAIKTKVHYTSEDNQKIATFSVYEGEHLMFSDNNFLGEFRLFGIREAPEVAKAIFEINENGILNVKATEQGTSNIGKIRIDRYTGTLSKEEIALYKQNESNYMAEDRRLRL